MRCKNCGWINEEGVKNCEKCHAPLDAPSSNIGTEPISDRVRGTVSEQVIFGDEGASTPVAATCPQCGYPVSPEMTSCPNCNFELKTNEPKGHKCPKCGKPSKAEDKFCSACGCSLSETPVPQSRPHIQRSGLGTVMGGPSTNPESNIFCTLKPIAWKGEEVTYSPITYSGDQIILNRANTDANNNSITSKVQAVITYEDGDWYIENQSELRTTYIRVGHKIKLENGDIIVLGNREFEFKK